MTRWGLFLVCIGCIIIMSSQVNESASLGLCFLGLLVVAGGFVLIYRDKKESKSFKKSKKKK